MAIHIRALLPEELETLSKLHKNARVCTWRYKCGRHLNLWVDDSVLHNFEACTETVDDGVAAFFLKAILCCCALRLTRG